MSSQSVTSKSGPDHRAACLVIMYHYVRDSERGTRNPLGLGWHGIRGANATDSGVRGLSTQAFRDQLDQLGRLMEPIDWPTLYAWRCGHGTIPERCFLLTFDDGLVDHAERVLPVLEERGLRGVFFVPGAVLTSHQLLPAHAIHLLLSTLDAKTLEREVLDYVSKHVGEDALHLTSIDWAQAEAMYHYEPPARARVKFLLTVALPPELRTAATNVLFERYVGSPERWARHWYMGWDDLARVQSSGHTVGAHGYTHAPYGGMTAAQRRDDMRKVNAVLCGGLGPGVRPFSYPHGQFDDDTCSACHEAGFAHAFTTERRWLTKGCDVFRLPRVRTMDVGVALAEDAQCVQA